MCTYIQYMCTYIQLGILGTTWIADCNFLHCLSERLKPHLIKGRGSKALLWFKGFSGVFRRVLGAFRGFSRGLKGILIEILRGFQGISRVFRGFSGGYQVILRRLSGDFQGVFKGISGYFGGFSGAFKGFQGVSGVFQGVFMVFSGDFQWVFSGFSRGVFMGSLMGHPWSQEVKASRSVVCLIFEEINN